MPPCSAQNSRIDIASGGPRIGGFVALPLHCGSLCAIGSTAPGSALGGPGLRLGGSAVTIGLPPGTSPPAIAFAPLNWMAPPTPPPFFSPTGDPSQPGNY